MPLNHHHWTHTIHVPYHCHCVSSITQLPRLHSLVLLHPILLELFWLNTYGLTDVISSRAASSRSSRYSTLASTLMRASKEFASLPRASTSRTICARIPASSCPSS